ncbi:hypothetical protein [Arthrobacter sp. HMWF013]|nr:hypothetical protein [Arthrobacter sp. HMWF013]
MNGRPSIVLIIVVGDLTRPDTLGPAVEGVQAFRQDLATISAGHSFQG